MIEQSQTTIKRERKRPTLYNQKMKQTAIWLPEDMINWLKAQNGSMSETVRELIRQAMAQ